MHFIFIHALVCCMSFMCFWHTCTVLFLHHHCLLNLLSDYYCHALLNISPYCYLIHRTKYFREGWIFHIQCWNIQSRGTKLGGQNFHDMPPDSPTLHTYTSNIHVIPLQKILAMGLQLYNQICTETLFLWTPVMQKSDHRKLIVALHTKVIFTSRRIKL